MFSRVGLIILLYNRCFYTKGEVSVVAMGTGGEARKESLEETSLSGPSIPQLGSMPLRHLPGRTSQDPGSAHFSSSAGCSNDMSLPPGVTAVILTMTLLITVLGTVIIGLILKMQSGKLQKQNKDIWWQINYDDIPNLPQNEVRPHLARIPISCSLLVICRTDLVEEFLKAEANLFIEWVLNRVLSPTFCFWASHFFLDEYLWWTSLLGLSFSILKIDQMISKVPFSSITLWV